jgi:uracil-DNA glycosylase
LEPGPRAVAGTPGVVLTTHPSSILRLRDSGDRRAAKKALVEDLRTAAAVRGA